MVNETFNYFFFEPILFDKFIFHFGVDYDFESPDYAIKVYDEWLLHFYKRANAFYRAQYEFHHQIVERAFCVENQLDRDQSPAECGLNAEWDAYSRERGLDSHFLEFENQSREIINQAESASNRSRVPSSYSASELVDRLIIARLGIANKKRPSTKEINELWFNSIITNSGETASELRRLPYVEYLKSRHWQKVRSAMLLIHGASCQAEGHFEMGETWYFGWEPEIDVHHLNYRNKGNERYSDLALLCHEHHKKWHEDILVYREPHFEILDADWY